MIVLIWLNFLNVLQKFIPGQDIDVWIKFVEEEGYKLGLQMFPVLGKGVLSLNSVPVDWLTNYTAEYNSDCLLD